MNQLQRCLEKFLDVFVGPVGKPMPPGYLSDKYRWHIIGLVNHRTIRWIRRDKQR